jgi:hypothetical protein
VDSRNPQHLAGAQKEAAWTFHSTSLKKPIWRIKTTCDLMGTSDEFERKLPELETYLEALVAKGETDEKHLAVNGMKFLKQANWVREGFLRRRRLLP